MANLVMTDFNQQGIGALKQGLGIGQAMNQRKQQEEAARLRQAQEQRQQALFGQQTQLNQGKLAQQEQLQGMSEMVTALNLPFDKRNDLFSKLESEKQNPAAKEFLGHLQTLGDEEQMSTMINILKQQQGGVGGDRKKDLPAETIAFNDLIKDFTPEQQKTAKLVKAGLKGRAMSNALLSAIESGDVKNLRDAKAEIKQAEKFAEMTGSSRAQAIDKGFERIVKIDEGIRNIDNAIRAIGGGAGVGAVEKLWPSIKAASVELDNIRGKMALDVVGATTFGALSKGELDLAKDIALPTGLDTKELKAYLTRKRDAQIKLKDYFNEQIQFLDQGGSVAGFLRMKNRGAKQGAVKPQAQPVSFSSSALGREVSEQDILDTLQANPGMTREQLFQQLGIQ